MTTETQNDAILSRLRRGDTITPMDALSAVGSFRLAARIYDLRRAGHDIETVAVPTKGGAVAGYRLRVRFDSMGQRLMP